MKVTIFGAGVVGSATGQAFHAKGHEVSFVDVLSAKIAQMRGLGYTAVAPDEADLSDTDAVFISVPTPSNEFGQDTSYLKAATISIGHALASVGEDRYPVVVFRCTQVPGMTDTLSAVLEHVSGKKAGVDFGVIYNPEYLRAETGNSPLEDASNPLIVTVGHRTQDHRSCLVMEQLYAPFEVQMRWMSFRAAELQKYYHNVYNAVKISFCNQTRLHLRAFGMSEQEIQVVFSTPYLFDNLRASFDREFDALCDHYQVCDMERTWIHKVSDVSCEALRNPKYGTRDLGPYAGACLPKEVIAILALADKLGIDLPVVRRTHEVNEMMKQLVLESQAA